MKKLHALFLLLSAAAFAQSINDYQYVIVPSRFSFLKSEDAYKTSTYTKMHFEKYGFKAYLDNGIPSELADQNCDKLFADLQEDNTLFSTKLRVVLKDCRGNVLYTSGEGKSREKDLQVAYSQALREAFRDFGNLNYKYNGTAVKSAAVIKPVEVVHTSGVLLGNNGYLTAQPIAGGFQLIDTEPKIVMKIFPTSNPDIFLAEAKTHGGVLYRKNDQWIFESRQEEKQTSQVYSIKF